MENLSKLWSWLKTLPFWARCVVLFLVSALIVVASMFVSSCGTPKTVATVQNVNPNSAVTVTMTVSNSNSTSVDTNATPSVSFNDLP